MNIWYLSKYVEVPSPESPGGRGFLLMRSVAAEGHSVTLITSTSNHLNFVPDITKSYSIARFGEIKLVWVNTLKFKSPKSLKRILSWLQFELKVLMLPRLVKPRPDIVIVSSPSIFSLLNGLLLQYRFGTKLIFEVRDIWPLTLTEEGGMAASNQLVKIIGLLEKVGYRKADAIVGTMPGLGTHVKDILGYAKPAHCIPMGLNDAYDDASSLLSDSFVSQYIPKGKFLVTYAGTIGATNALETLFLTAEALLTYTHIHFLVVGRGSRLQFFKCKYSHLSNLTFVPAVEKSKIGHFLSYTDVCYFATYRSKVWDYGQSLAKVVEYMRAGKPVIGSYSGLESMVNEAECGVFVEAENERALADAVLFFAGMSQKRRLAIGKNGRVWVERHRSYKELGRQYCEVFDSI